MALWTLGLNEACIGINHVCVCVAMCAVEEPQLSMTRLDPSSTEDSPLQPAETDGEAGAAIRPSLNSGYSKQFQKSLPPRFLRQQVLLLTPLHCFPPLHIVLTVTDLFRSLNKFAISFYDLKVFHINTPWKVVHESFKKYMHDYLFAEITV